MELLYNFCIYLGIFIVGMGFGIIAGRSKLYNNIGTFSPIDKYFKMVPYDWFYMKVEGDTEVYLLSVTSMLHKAQKDTRDRKNKRKAKK